MNVYVVTSLLGMIPFAAVLVVAGSSSAPHAFDWLPQFVTEICFNAWLGAPAISISLIVYIMFVKL